MFFRFKIQAKPALSQDRRTSAEGAFPVAASLFHRLPFDGRHSILDIQAEYMRDLEISLYRKLQEIVSQLEEALYLEGERFKMP